MNMVNLGVFMCCPKNTLEEVKVLCVQNTLMRETSNPQL